jgi:hypothetical protein
MAKTTQKSGGKFTVKGGKGKMFGQMGAKPAKAGVISQSQSGKGGKFAYGGKGHMFGKQSATPAKAR